MSCCIHAVNMLSLPAGPSACPAVLPPGKFMSQGLVRLCPQGFYRETWVTFDSPNGTLCKPCRPGITTEGAGSGPASMCNVVIPGFGIAAIKNVTGPGSIPALPTNTTSDGGLPAATMCDYGYYSLGGYCAECPSATITRSRGAKSVEECSKCLTWLHLFASKSKGMHDGPCSVVQKLHCRLYCPT